MGVIADLKWLAKDPRLLRERNFIERLLKLDLYLEKQGKVLLKLIREGKSGDAHKLVGLMGDEMEFMRRKLGELSARRDFTPSEKKAAADAVYALNVAMNLLRSTTRPGNKKPEESIWLLNDTLGIAQ